MADNIRLTTTELRAAVSALEREELTQRMFARWTTAGIVKPSDRWGRKRTSHLWTLSDIARVRLAMKLRRGGVLPARMRAIFAYLETELEEVLKPGSAATLVVADARAYVQRPGEPDIEVPSGQLRLRLKLDRCFVGNEKAAEKVLAA